MRTRTGEIESSSLNQEYSVFWNKSLLPYIDARAYLRYHNFGLDQGLGSNVWREEYQPSGEIIWTHPLFSAGFNVTRQSSRSNNNASNLIRDGFTFNMSTRISRYPTFAARYLWNKTYNQASPPNRDSRDRQIHASLDYMVRNNTLYYGFTVSENLNLLSEIDTDEIQHIFRWSRFGRMLDDKFTLNTDYNFRQRSQSIRKPLSGLAFEEIPVFYGLYSYDTSPELDGLDTLSTLSDGNLSDPAQPEIDIGSGLIDRNIGVDLGYAQDISALYIYTDRPSGSQLQWNVYLSSDNFSWIRAAGPATSSFNSGYNRYEVTFPAQKTRYIKVVNSGTNDVVTVLVTEMEALKDAPESEKIDRRQTIHTFDLGGTYKFSEKFRSAADMTYKYEPRGDFGDSKDQLYYTLSTQHSPSAYVTHLIRFQAGYEQFKSSGIVDKTRKIAYSLLAKPIESAEFAFSAGDQYDYRDAMKMQEIQNAVIDANGAVLRGLDVQGEIGFSRIKRADSGRKYDAWTYRISSASELTRSLDLNASFLYQSTRDNAIFAPRKRKQLSLNSNYRATAAILMQASYYLNDDSGLHNITQDYEINWNAGRKITVGGSVYLIRNSDGTRIDRYTGRLNVRVSSRTSVFTNYYRQVYWPVDVLNNSSVQIGLKSGF